MLHPSPSKAIEYAKNKLYNLGQVVEQATWQSVKSPDNTIELFNHSLSFVIPKTQTKLVEEVKPHLPWADEHFKERVSGVPYNPPPSHEIWPFNQNKNEKFRKREQFSHTYPERFWPKHDTADAIFRAKKGKFREGIRFNYGDFRDIPFLLNRDSSTRQAYLPIWFPEDLTAARSEERVPCTLGYHFIIRNGMLHINYYMRSCDIIRHFRDDIYLACLLVYYIQDSLNFKVEPGILTMYITSLHCFTNDRPLLKNPKY